MLASEGSIEPLFTRPIALLFIVLSVGSLFLAARIRKLEKIPSSDDTEATS